MMFRRPDGIGSSNRAGGVLLEILLAIALFAGAAAFALGSLRAAFNSIDHTTKQQQAVDLARSKMAELEAGLINLSDLRGGTDALSSDTDETSAIVAISDDQWLFDVKTHRSEFANLSLIELTVRENLPHDANAVEYTLRQLLRLREPSTDEFEFDELSEGSDS